MAVIGGCDAGKSKIRNQKSDQKVRRPSDFCFLASGFWFLVSGFWSLV